MHRGPLLAYLMADPELSLQSILIVAAIIGRLKAWTYVGWVALFSTLAGLLYGAWVDGTSAWLVAGYLAAFLAAMALGLYLLGRRDRRSLGRPGAVNLDANDARTSITSLRQTCLHQILGTGCPN
jgi:hypothetical protein